MREIRNIILILIATLPASCSRIENGKDLKQKDVEYIRNLGLLDDDEIIFRFYSEYKNSVAGNFFTDKRIATYWIDPRNAEKNKSAFAHYHEIIRIDKVYYAGATYTPFMRITKNDSSTFKVNVDGDRKDVKVFFEDALREWKKRKDEKQ